MSNSWILIIRPAISTLDEILNIALSRLSRKKYNQLLSTLIAQLLKKHPDITPAKARQKAIQAIGVPPNNRFLQRKKIQG
jgi:hypothetical protein